MDVLRIYYQDNEVDPTFKRRAALAGFAKAEMMGVRDSEAIINFHPSLNPFLHVSPLFSKTSFIHVMPDAWLYLFPLSFHSKGERICSSPTPSRKNSRGGYDRTSVNHLHHLMDESGVYCLDEGVGKMLNTGKS